MTALNDAVANLSAKIQAQAATASAEELAWLSKALDTIGGRVALIDVQALADERKFDLGVYTDARKGDLGDLVTNLRAAITAQVNTAKSDITLLGTATNKTVTDNANTTINSVNTARDNATNAGNAAVTAVGLAKQGALDAISASQNLVVTLQATVNALSVRALDLPARKTIVAGTAAVTLAVADIALVVDLDAARTLDFTTIAVTLPDATTLPAAVLHKELAIKNRSLATLRFLNAAGTLLAIVQPNGWGRLVLSSQSAAAGVWRLTPLSLPAVRDRLTNHSGGNTFNYAGEFNGPSGQGLHSGYATYADFAQALPCYDDLGVTLKSAIVTRARDTNWGYTGTWVAPLTDDQMPAGFINGSSSTTYMWSATNAYISTAIPVRGGFVVLGANNVTNLFDIGFFRSTANFGTRINVENTLTLANTYYYAVAHTFGDGQYLVVAFANSSGQFTLLRRYRFKSDGTVETAGSITLAASGSTVAQINDQFMAVHNGTAFGIYDMTAAGTTLTPVSTPASPFPASMGNKFAMPVGRDCLIASDGAYRWDGTNLTKLAGGAGYAYAGNPGGYQAQAIVFRDGFSSLVGPIGLNQFVNYFSDAGTFLSRAATRMVGPGVNVGSGDARIWPHSADAVMTSYSWVLQIAASYVAGMNTGTTELTRVAPGNIGVSGLGGK